ncbi:MAG: hypothetical protein V1712_00055 [Patescibacteria group bacterium]
MARQTATAIGINLISVTVLLGKKIIPTTEKARKAKPTINSPFRLCLWQSVACWEELFSFFYPFF